jgi:hypothetical protein
VHRIVYTLDIDTTLADNTHRKYLLKDYCARCGALSHIETIGSSYKMCANCGCDVFNIPKSSYVDYAEPRLLALDVPVPNTQWIVKCLANRADINYITARAEDAYKVTEQWLIDNYDFNPERNKLITRSGPSYADRVGVRIQPAATHKRLAFQELMKQRKYDKKDFFIFIDDNYECLQMYAEYGLALKAPECWNLMNVTNTVQY